MPDGATLPSPASVHDGDVRLVKQGDGSLVLTAASTHTGGISVEAGLLVVRNPGTREPGNLAFSAAGAVALALAAAEVAVTSMTIAAGGQLDLGRVRMRLGAGGDDFASIITRITSGSCITSTAAAAESGRAGAVGARAGG